MYKCIVEDNTIEFHVRGLLLSCMLRFILDNVNNIYNVVCHQLEKNEKSRTSNSDNGNLKRE